MAAYHLLNALNETFTAFSKEDVELVVKKLEILIFTQSENEDVDQLKREFDSTIISDPKKLSKYLKV